MELDIEKLERKIPELPENFFAQMQENVLQNTVHKKPEAKVFRINYAWAAAAAIALILGLTFIVSTENDGNTAPVIATTEKVQQASPATAIVTTEPVEETAQRVAYENFKEDLEAVEVSPQPKAIAKTSKKPAPTQKTEVIAPEENVELLLSSFTSEELDELSEAYQQDIYLELYN